MWKNVKVLVRLFGFILIVISLSNLISFIVSRAYHHMAWHALIFFILYLISGIGIIFLKLWARWLVIICSVYRVVQTPVQLLVWVNSIGGWSKVEVGSVIFTILITIAINLLVVYFLTRPKVKEQFN